MRGADSTHVARPVAALSSDGRGGHPAEKWAWAVARGMVSIDPGTPDERRNHALALRGRVEAVLRDAFVEAKPTATIAGLARTAEAALGRVNRIFAGTPWEMFAANPRIQAEFGRYLFTNLADAAGLAIRTE